MDFRINFGNTVGSTGNTCGSKTGDTSTCGSNGVQEKLQSIKHLKGAGYVGNSGKVFGSAVEANTLANGQIDSGTSDDNGYSGYKLITIFYSDGSKKFSIDWC